MDDKVIIETLKEMLSDLCDGCGGCKDKCLDYQVLEYLINERGGHSCKTCKYYSYAFDKYPFGYPCTNCQRNFKLVDEIREQKNDLWKEN